MLENTTIVVLLDQFIKIVALYGWLVPVMNQLSLCLLLASESKNTLVCTNVMIPEPSGKLWQLNCFLHVLEWLSIKSIDIMHFQKDIVWSTFAKQFWSISHFLLFQDELAVLYGYTKGTKQHWTELSGLFHQMGEQRYTFPFKERRRQLHQTREPLRAPLYVWVFASVLLIYSGRISTLHFIREGLR